MVLMCWWTTESHIILVILTGILYSSLFCEFLAYHYLRRWAAATSLWTVKISRGLEVSVLVIAEGSVYWFFHFHACLRYTHQRVHSSGCRSSDANSVFVPKPLHKHMSHPLIFMYVCMFGCVLYVIFVSLVGMSVWWSKPPEDQGSIHVQLPAV